MSRRPNPLPRYYRWRSNIVQFPLFCLITVFCGSLALFVSLFEKSGRIQHRIAQLWARLCVVLSFARLTVRGAENLRKCPIAVYAGNHTSYMDTPVIFASLPFQFRILAKNDLWKMPFIGWYLNRSGQIPVESESARGSHASLSAGVRALKAGMPLFVFPEGSRTPDGSLKEFMSGAAYLALRAQVPLVPVALNGVFDLLPMHTHHVYPEGGLILSVGEPIQTAGMSVRQTPELNDRLRAAIADLMAKAEGCPVESQQASV
jgi:1-acyl-sn-glycerol-3-phosphate acyltransferase